MLVLVRTGHKYRRAGVYVWFALIKMDFRHNSSGGRLNILIINDYTEDEHPKAVIIMKVQEQDRVTLLK